MSDARLAQGPPERFGSVWACDPVLVKVTKISSGRYICSGVSGEILNPENKRDGQENWMVFLP